MAKKKFTRVVDHANAKYSADVKGFKLSKKTAILDNASAFERYEDDPKDRAPVDQKAKKLNKSYKEVSEKYGADSGEPISGDDIAKMGKKRIDSSSLNREHVDLAISGLHSPKDRGSNPARRSGV
jgi:hypothetical protein